MAVSRCGVVLSILGTMTVGSPRSPWAPPSSASCGHQRGGHAVGHLGQSCSALQGDAPREASANEGTWPGTLITFVTGEAGLRSRGQESR